MLELAGRDRVTLGLSNELCRDTLQQLADPTPIQAKAYFACLPYELRIISILLGKRRGTSDPGRSAARSVLVIFAFKGVRKLNSWCMGGRFLPKYMQYSAQ
jgi:hypothetical protein